MKKHILLIDDDKEELEILNEALADLPYPLKCTWAQSADHALKMIPYLAIDFILVDYNMPKINGLECIAMIKKLNMPEDVPVIIYSTYLDEKVCKKAKALGAAKCIKKPDCISSLTNLLNDVIMKQAV